MKYIFILASSSVLDASKGVDLGQFIQVILGTVCLLIDSVVYWVTSLAFKLFLAISQFELFNTSTFNDIIDRTYVVIGVVSLFLVAYALLNANINPDNFSKGDKSISKIVKNLIIAVIGIAIVPTLFNYFYYFQKVILCNNTIPKLLLKNVSDDGNTVENTAKEFSALVFESFFYPNAASSVGDEAVDLTKAAAGVKLEKEDPYYGENKNDPDYDDDGYYSLSDAYFNAEKGRSFWISFSPFLLGEGFANGIVDNSVQYLVILSTIAGGYIAYVMISLCIDMGMRAVKLGYLELIAPLAIMTTIVPGKDSVYKNWIKKTTSCALEVFTRLFVVVFAVYLINTIKDMNLPSWISSVCGITLWPIAGLLLRTLVIASIFAFIKQAPKFFSEATGIKSDGFKIGIMDKLKENGMLQGLGAVGAAATTGIRNGAAGFAAGGVGGAAMGALKSFPQAIKAGQKGWSKVKDAKKWSDVKNGITTSASEAEKEHQEWQDYKKSHGGKTTSAIRAKISDAFDDFINDPESAYKRAKNQSDKLNKAVKSRTDYTDWTKDMLSKDKYKSKFAYNGKTWEKLNQEKDLAEKTREVALKQKAEADLLEGDDSYTQEAIASERVAADKEVTRLENLSKLVLPKEEKDRINQELQIARNRQTAAYTKQADYSKTKAGVAEIQRVANNRLEAANDALNLANDTLRKAKKDIDNKILEGAYADVIDGDETHELETHITEMRTAINDALPELVNSSNYSNIKSAVDTDRNNGLYEAIGHIKDENYEVAKKLSEYGEAIRKKSENKK